VNVPNKSFEIASIVKQEMFKTHSKPKEA